MWHTRIWNVWSDAVKVNLIYQKQKSKKSAEKIFYFWWPQFVMNQMEVPVPPILLTMVVPVLDSPTYLVVVAALEPTTSLLLLMQCSVPKSSRTNIQAIILDNNLCDSPCFPICLWLFVYHPPCRWCHWSRLPTTRLLLLCCLAAAAFSPCHHPPISFPWVCIHCSLPFTDLVI